MAGYDYEFGTTPKKRETIYKPSRKTKKEIKKQIEINEAQRKNAIKTEKKHHAKNICLILAIFLILLTISYRS